MKQLFITLTIFTSTLFGTANATEGTASPKAVAAFENTFSNATEISWKDLGSMSKVSFTINGVSTFAFYDNEGELVATARNISSIELPGQLRKALLKEMKTFWISDLFVVNGEEGTTYYVNLANADSKKMLKSTNGKKWSVHHNSNQ